MFDLEPLPLKYELCELILGDVTPGLEDVGLTVMDGPFFSVMPYGLSGFPFFVAVDSSGKVVERASGELTTQQFDALLAAARSGGSAS